MRFLTRLGERLFPSAASPERKTTIPLVKSTEALTTPKYCDDSILRQLAKDYEDGKTTWVLASDMSEFFKKLDAYNDSTDPNVVISILKEVNDILKDYIESGIHLNSDSVRAEGRLVLDAKNILHFLGPQSIEGLLVSNNDRSYNAVYEAGPRNTSIKILSLTGKWVSLDFGMEGVGLSSQNKPFVLG